MKKRIIVYGILLVLLVASGAAYYSHIQGEIEKNEAKREAEERYRRHLKLEQSEEYNPGWTGEGVVKNLREALEAAPANYEIRMKLAQVLNERRGHSDNMLEEHCRVLEGGLGYMDRYEPEQRQKLIRGISIRCQQQIYPELELGELQQMWIDKAPYTSEAIRRQLGRASAKAKQGEEDALKYITQTRERVKEHARRTDTKPEKKLLYLDYLKGVYWKQKGEYEKAADIFVRLYDKGGVWKVNKSDLKNTALPVLEKVKRWEDIKHIVENFYETKSSFDFSDFENWSERSKELFLRTTDGQLWKEAKEKLGE